MVGTDMVFGAALVRDCQLRALMWAHVDEGAYFTIGRAGEQNRGARNPARDVVTRLLDLDVQSKKTPTALEDVLQLELEEIGVGVHIPMHPKDPFPRPIVDIVTQVQHGHLQPLAVWLTPPLASPPSLDRYAGGAWRNVHTR